MTKKERDEWYNLFVEVFRKQLVPLLKEMEERLCKKIASKEDIKKIKFSSPSQGL